MTNSINILLTLALMTVCAHFTYAVHFKIYDEKYGNPVDAEVVIKTTKYDFLVGSGKASAEGVFTSELKPRDYYIKVSKSPYYFPYEELILVRSSTDTIEVELTRIEVINCVSFPETYFKFGSTDFDNIELQRYGFDRLADLLKENPKLNIEIQGHQHPSEKNYTLLSYERAKKVAEELVSRGVNRNNILISFFNWSVPVNPGDLPSVRNREKEKVAKQMSQRVEFKFEIPEGYSYTNEAKQLKIEQRDP